jgi:hypothetical protein
MAIVNEGLRVNTDEAGTVVTGNYPLFGVLSRILAE